MKSAASQFRDRPELKRRQDLDDIAVLERLRADQRTGRGEAGRTTAWRSGQHRSATDHGIRAPGRHGTQARAVDMRAPARGVAMGAGSGLRVSAAVLAARAESGAAG